eukprot:gene1983-1491_t
MFVIQNYQVLNHNKNTIAYDVLDLCLCSCFLFHWIVDWFLSRNKCWYVISFNSVLDYISIIPTLGISIGTLAGFDLASYSWLQLIRIMRLFRLFVLFYDINRISLWSSVKSTIKKAATLILTIITLILLFSAILQAIENALNPDQIIYFHDAVYWMCITLLSIGYGDYTPKTTPGKFFVVLFVILGIILIPYQATKLIQLVISGRKFYHQYVHLNLKKHIIVGGYSPYEDIVLFIEEFYHEQHDHETSKIEKMILVFNNMELVKKLERQFYSSAYEKNIIVHFGDLTKFEQLEMLNTDHAVAVFLLSSTKDEESSKEDSSVLLMAKTIKNYRNVLPIYAQTLNLKYKEFLLQIGVNVVICLDDFRYKILGQSLVSPGLASLIGTLISSHSFKEDIIKKEKTPWKSEYYHGAMTGIYKTSISSYYNNYDFIEFARECKSKFDIYVFGIETKGSKIEINPGKGFKISSGDFALVFALSEYHSRAVSLFKNDPYDSEVLIDHDDEYIIDQSESFRHSKKIDDIIEIDNSQLKNVKYDSNESEERIKKKTIFELIKIVAPIDYLNSNLKNCSEEERETFYEKVVQNFQLLTLARKKEAFHMKKTELKQLKNHIIISGDITGSLYLCLTLRFKERKNVPIILLYDFKKDSDEYNQLYRQMKFFDEVYFVKGTSSSRENLKSCSIEKCKVFIFIASNDINIVRDSQTVQTYLTIRSIGKIRFVLEIVDQNSVEFFSDRKKIFKKSAWGAAKEENYVFSPLFVSGRLISCANLMDKLLCQSFFNPSLPKIIEYFCGLGELFSNSDQPSIKSIVLPERFINKTFDECFDQLLDESVVALGIYRERKKNENEYEYVYLSPNSDAVLNKKDKLFVIESLNKNMGNVTTESIEMKPRVSKTHSAFDYESVKEFSLNFD